MLLWIRFRFALGLFLMCFEVALDLLWALCSLLLPRILQVFIAKLLVVIGDEKSLASGQNPGLVP
jgi:hypothetical protein